MNKNIKAQQVLSAVMVVILIITVFSFAFMIEPEETVKNNELRLKENELRFTGIKIVSGMVVLNDILDIAAEQDRELIVSAKDGNYYKIRKKGDEWYYSDTTVKVSAENMNSAFNYYKVSEVPVNIDVKAGAPYFNVEKFDNKITGMVVGMEGVSGMAGAEGEQGTTVKIEGKTTYIWDRPEGGRQETSTQPTIVVDYQRKITGVPDQRDKLEHFKAGAQEPWKVEELNPTTGAWEPAAEKTELKLYEGYYNDKWYDLPEQYESLKGAQEVCKGVCEKVREKRVTTVTGIKYNVLDQDNVFIGSVIVKPGDDPVDRGEFLAKLLSKNFDHTELPKFKLSSQAAGEKIYEAENLEAAKTQFRQEWGNNPETFVELKPGTTISGNTYFIVDKTTGERITTLNNVISDEAANTILSNFQNNPLYEGKRQLELKKVPSLEDLIKQNPTVPVHILQKELETYVAPRAKEEEIKEPQLYKFKVGDKETYYVNDIRYEKEAEANTAFVKAREAFIKAVTKKYAEEQLKENKLTLTGKITEDDELLAKDAKGGIYKFLPMKDGSGKVTGGEFKDVGAFYTTKETIGEGDEAVDVIRTFETRTGKETGIKVKAKDNKEASVDEDIIKQIKDALGKGLKPNIEAKILEFRDKDGNLIAKTTLSEEYTLNKGTKTTEKFRTAYFHGGREITEKEKKKLEEEGKGSEIKTISELQTFKQIEEKENGGLRFLTTYEYDIEFAEDKEPIVVYEAVKIDVEKGELVQFIYSKNGNEIVLNSKGDKIEGDDSLLPEAKKALTQLKSRQFFAGLETMLTQFRGLGYYSSWFFSDKALGEWRERVDRAFAKAYLGIEYWESGICSSKIEKEQKGVAYVDTRLGLAGVAAHIEATSSGAITSHNQTEYLYKITFNVKNGDWENDPKALEEMEFNVYLYGNRRAKLLKKDTKLKKGESFGRIREKVIVQYSSFFYDKICIEFKEVPASWKSLKDKKLCNAIAGPAEEAEKIVREKIEGEEIDEEILQI